MVKQYCGVCFEAYYYFLKDHGIGNQMFISYTRQKNGMVERANYIIVEMAMNMLHAHNLDKLF